MFVALVTPYLLGYNLGITFLRNYERHDETIESLLEVFVRGQVAGHFGPKRGLARVESSTEIHETQCERLCNTLNNFLSKSNRLYCIVCF